jgi:hypothetical protein
LSTALSTHYSVDAKVLEVFNRFDNDGNGHIDEEELGEALRAFNLNVNDEQAKKVLVQYDDDCNGTIEIEEFANLVNHFSKFTTLRGINDQRGPKKGPPALAPGEAPPVVKSLDNFLTLGSTGFTPRDGEMDVETEAVLSFLRDIGVTKNTDYDDYD